MAEKKDEQYIHRGGQTRNTRALRSQVISSMTSLIQDLLNISHLRNRKIFAGTKRLRIKMWPAGHRSE